MVNAGAHHWTKCGSTMFRKGSKLYCAKEGCGYEMPVPKKE